MTDTSSVATLLLERRLGARQRFDSADFAMGLHHKQGRSLPPVVAAVPRPRHHQVEHEPEPESQSFMAKHHHEPQQRAVTRPAIHIDTSGRVPEQQVRRIRLQRFDSADWAMQCHQTQLGRVTSSGSPGGGATELGHAGIVAKLLLDRHAYTTCHFVSTPVNPPQHYVENA